MRAIVLLCALSGLWGCDDLRPVGSLWVDSEELYEPTLRAVERWNTAAAEAGMGPLLWLVDRPVLARTRIELGIASFEYGLCGDTVTVGRDSYEFGAALYVLSHALGHALGLDDAEDSGVMYPVLTVLPPTAEDAARAADACD